MLILLSFINFYSPDHIKHVSQQKLISELMNEDPSDRPSAADAMERLKDIARKAKEEAPFQDYNRCLGGMFQEGDVEDDTRKEGNEEEEDDLENAVRRISTARDIEEFNEAMNRILS